VWSIMQSLSLHTCYLLYKCVVAKLGSKAGNFSSGKREGEGGGERLRYGERQRDRGEET
jgi:hypothetical protein